MKNGNISSNDFCTNNGQDCFFSNFYRFIRWSIKQISQTMSHFYKTCRNFNVSLTKLQNTSFPLQVHTIECYILLQKVFTNKNTNIPIIILNLICILFSTSLTNHLYWFLTRILTYINNFKIIINIFSYSLSSCLLDFFLRCDR